FQEAPSLHFAGTAADSAQDFGMVFRRNAQPAGDGLYHRASSPIREMPRQEWLDWPGRDRSSGDLHQCAMAENEKRGLVRADRLAFAPLPQLTQDRQSRAPKQMAAFDAPHRIHVRRTLLGAPNNQTSAGFLVPGQPP